MRKKPTKQELQKILNSPDGKYEVYTKTDGSIGARKVGRLFTRKELWKLAGRAESLAGVRGTNPSWVRVYLRLADAACELDAYIARSEVADESVMS